MKNREFESNLRELRENNKKRAAEVSARLGVALSSYYNYENGLREINIRQVLVLAEFYDCTAQEIIEAQLNSHQFAR